MKRRNLVSLCGTAGLASLAGCQTFGSTLEEEPPRFEEVSLSGPSGATVGESVSLSVSVTNAGGQNGTFSDALTVESGADSKTTVRIEEIPPSESKTVEVGPYVLGYAGDHRFALAETGASHVVSVSAPTLRAGKPFAVPDGPEVVVSDATPYASLFYDRQEGESEQSDRGVLAPDDESVFVVFRVSVTNRGHQPVSVGPSSFDVADGELVTGLGTQSESLGAISGLEGEPFSDESIAAGGSQSGWLLAEVPRESVASSLEVAWNRPLSQSDSRAEGTAGSASNETTGSQSSDTTATDSRETTGSQSSTTTQNLSDAGPEARWTFDPGEPPQFEVADLTLLDATEFGSSVTATATVQNAGSVSSTYRGVLERRDAEQTDQTDETEQTDETDESEQTDGAKQTKLTDWTRLETFERELSPGTSTTVTAEVSASAVGASEYRLRPGSATEEMTVRPAERALGEAFTTPEGVTIQVEVGTDAFDGLFGSYIYKDLNNQTVRTGSGHTFAFVQVMVENTTNESVRFPDRRAFSVVADGTTSSVFHSSSSEDVTFQSPVEGPWYAPNSESEPGATHSGWLVFQVPKDVTVADLTVRWSPTDDEVATWSAES